MCVKKINIIGSGNVATHFVSVLHSKIQIINIFSYNIENAISLSNKVQKGIPISNIELIENDVDLNIIALKDDAIENIIPYLNKKTPIVHTSGSLPIDIFKDFDSYGILYPLQTFSKNKNLDISVIPFLLEANTNDFLNLLNEFCHQTLSKNTHFINSKQREQIHVAAVFANNFSTQMMIEAESILKENQIDFQILKELMKESIDKIFELGPKQALTGPAKRKDNQIIQKHIEMLNDPKQKEIYRLLTERILKG